MRRDSDWSFEVKPGHISYPGQIIVRGSRGTLRSSGSLQSWITNRPTMALEQLRETFPKIFATVPMTNGRSERDDFLDHYQQLIAPEHSTVLGTLSE